MNTDDFLSPTELRRLFIHQLNRVNCTKGYLIRNLPKLAEIASFKNMQMAIMETHEDVQKQQLRIDKIYELLGSAPSDEGCEVVKAVIDEAYNLGYKDGKSTIMNDMDIILYMQMIENMEYTSFKMLRLINQFMGDQQITQLLSECCDENMDNAHLFTLITEEYLVKKSN
ncbi:MAG: DUF892 family protein [Bacteroidetes bacterium]|nr:DUF892 family protein [Bacteroidota bacterium]